MEVSQKEEEMIDTMQQNYYDPDEIISEYFQNTEDEISITKIKKDNTEEESVFKVKEESTSNDLLLEQEYIYKNISDIESVKIETPKTKETISTPSYIESINNNISSMMAQIASLKEADEKLNEVVALEKKQEELEIILKREEQLLSDRISKKISNINNDVYKSQSLESSIKPSLFRKLISKLDLTSKLKLTFPNLFKKENLKSPDQEQQLNNTLYNKLKLKEKIKNKILNENNIRKSSSKPMTTTQDADRLAQEIMMSIFKPLDKLENIGQSTKKNTPEINTDGNNVDDFIKQHKPDISFILNNNHYEFIKYSDDLKKIHAVDINGRSIELNNNDSIVLKLKKEPSISEMQKNLLNQGKTLKMDINIKGTTHSFAANMKEGKLELKPLQKEQMEKSIKILPTKKNSIVKPKL